MKERRDVGEGIGGMERRAKRRKGKKDWKEVGAKKKNKRVLCWV